MFEIFIDLLGYIVAFGIETKFILLGVNVYG